MTDIKKETPKALFMRTLADPVLIYAVIAMMSIMNHYRSSLTVAYGIAAYVIGWAIFRLFDFINRHHVIGSFAYIAMFTAFILTAKLSIEKGGRDYPISWGLWFLTPQDLLQYNKWYTFAIFLLFLVFMLSVIYYFTRVRYRMFMNFLILIIPFSIYGKENEEMKIGFIIALCVGFFIVLANFRQMSDSKEAKAIDKPEMWKSAAVFTVLFALAASLIPKPVIEADRTMIETVINADALTDRFLEMLSVFRDDSTGGLFRGASSNMPLYYATSPQPLQLKTSTFTDYDYKKDSWKASQRDSRYWFQDDMPFPIYYSGGVAEAVIYAAQLDSGFAEKYGLAEYAEKGIKPPVERTISIFSANRGGNTAPVPMGASEMTSTTYSGVIGLSKAGTVFSDEGNFSGQEQFSFNFVSPGFFSNENNKAAANCIAAAEDYPALLEDAKNALLNYKISEFDYDDRISDEINEYIDIIDANNNFYEAAAEELLDYGGNQRVYDLAAEITAGMDSPYDKAVALEYYFIENDYIYDLEYQKAVGENVEDFLFDSKTGVCYEYATAMTLLARAAGIPARYCEGFNMQTKNGEDSDNYVITAMDAHGFPELYIKGYGWMTFEPTMTNGIVQEEEKSASGLLWRTGLFILAFSVIALLLIIIAPMLIHGFFLILVRRKSPNEAVSAVIRRICRIYGIPRTATAHEAEAEVYRRSGMNITMVTELFERAEYGGTKLTEADKTKAIEEYVFAYKALGEAKKAERKLRRRKRA